METCDTGLAYRRLGSARRRRGLLFRLATIAVALGAATLICIGEEWLLLEAPGAGIEFGVAVRAADVSSD